MKVFRLIISAMAMAIFVASTVSLAQDFPSKPLRFVTDIAAGGGGDVILRVLSPHISSAIGQPVFVENRPGGGGIVAAEFVARAAPDGYTCLAASQNPLIIRPYLVKKQSLNVFKDLTAITLLWQATTVVLSNGALPVTSLAELIEYAKANPGKLSYGSSGFGSSHHFTGEELQQLTRTKMVHIPYTGGIGAIKAVMTGEVQVAIGLAQSAVPIIRSSKVRVLALVQGKRFSSMPDVPYVSAIVPGFEPPPSWVGLFTAAGLPSDILRRLHSDVAKALSSPKLRFQSVDEGYELIANAPEEFTAQLRSEFNLIGRISKSAGIQPAD